MGQRRAAVVAFLIFCVAACSTTVMADSLTSSVPFSGEWKGGAYSDTQSHRFDYCVASVAYRSGITMAVAVDRGYAWRIAFADPAWNLAVGREIQLVISFDGGPQWAVAGSAPRADMVKVEMPNNSALISAFRGAYLMTVQALGATYGFDLTNTSDLIPELVQCVRSRLAIEAGNGTPLLGTAAEPAPPAQTPVGNPRPADANAELAATRIASNLLLAAGLPNARLLSPSETPASLRGRGVVWTSDIGAGAVELLPAGAARDPQDVASSLISADATTCKGEFASGRSSELVDNRVVAKAFTGCKDSDGAQALRYFVVQATNGQFVVYVVTASAASGPPSPGSPLADAVFQSAAVRATYPH